jgi:hypothetical protein
LTPPTDSGEMHQLYTGKEPFPSLSPGMVVRAIIGGIPPLSTRPAANSRREMPSALWSIVESCWRYNRKDRLSIKDVVDRLHQIPNF